MSFFTTEEKTRLLNRAKADRLVISQIFESQGVFVRVPDFRISPIGTFFFLDKKPSQAIGPVRKIMDDISIHISSSHGAAVECRLSEKPLYIEVPHANPKPIFWDRLIEVDPHMFSAGVGYSFDGSFDMVFDFGRNPHILIAGQTGSGKSVLLMNIIFSLAMNTSPDDLEFYFIDCKNEDLVEASRLPHVKKFAGSSEEAAALLSMLERELDRRVRSKAGRRIVIVIDELAQVKDAGSVKRLERLTALGRSVKMNVISATQHPNKDTLGSAAAIVNYVMRLTGKVSNAGVAALCAGQGETGAERLPGNGAFIMTGVEGSARFQSRFIDMGESGDNTQNGELPELVDLVCEAWGSEPSSSFASGVPVPVSLESEPVTVSHVGGAVASSSISPELAGVFELYHDGDGGLVHGGTMKAVRAMYGEEAKTGGGTHQRQRAAVLDRLGEWAGTLEGAGA